MNKLFLFIIIIFMVTMANGSDFRPERGRYIFFPSHPLLEQQVYIREDALTVEYKKYSAVGEEMPVESSGYKIERSKDGLTDTVYYHYGMPVYVDIYNDDHKLIAEQVDITFVPGYIYFTYDQKGRVKSASYYLNPDQQDKILEVLHTYQDTQTIYTDSGYIHTIIKESRKWPEVLEGNPDKVIIKKDTLITEYVFDGQNRLIRAGNDRYTYLESEEIIRNSIYDDERDVKYESYYDKKGLRQKTVRYFLKEGMWEISEVEKVTYYKDGVPVSTEPVMASGVSGIYGVCGGIILPTGTDQPVRIYNFSGRLVKQVNAMPDQFIPLLRGMYIVVSGNYSCKVVVR